MSSTLQCPAWNGHPKALGLSRTLKKRSTLPSAWRSTEETLNTQESWKAARIEKGWS